MRLIRQPPIVESTRLASLSPAPDAVDIRCNISSTLPTPRSDTELGGKQIKAGDKVVMWYVSGNRDAAVFEDPDRFLIERPNVRKHLSFGYGIHRCMGSQLAELQLKILWEEILARFAHIEVVGEPERTPSIFVKGYTALPVRLHARQH